MFLLMKFWLLYQQTGKSVKTRSAQTSSADAPQPSQAPTKRKGPKSTETKPKRQKKAPSSPPHSVSPIQIASSPSPPETQTQEALSPPQPAPQPQEAPADVSEQIADPAKAHHRQLPQNRSSPYPLKVKH